MPDPTLDLVKLKVILDWAEDLVDELNLRNDLLPCKSKDRVGDCISRQKKHLVEEMKPRKMCIRCQSRWHFLMGLVMLQKVHSAKTDVETTGSPDWT